MLVNFQTTEFTIFLNEVKKNNWVGGEADMVKMKWVICLIMKNKNIKTRFAMEKELN